MLKDEPLSCIIQHMQEDGFRNWGFVVYRCAYANDSQWESYLEFLKEAVREDLEFFELETLLWKHLKWTIIEDPDPSREMAQVPTIPGSERGPDSSTASTLTSDASIPLINTKRGLSRGPLVSPRQLFARFWIGPANRADEGGMGILLWSAVPRWTQDGCTQTLVFSPVCMIGFLLRSYPSATMRDRLRCGQWATRCLSNPRYDSD
jgi:hypothetical protein